MLSFGRQLPDSLFSHVRGYGPAPERPGKILRFSSNLRKTADSQYLPIVVRASLAETAVMATIYAASTVAKFPWSKLLLKNYFVNI